MVVRGFKRAEDGKTAACSGFVISQGGQEELGDESLRPRRFVRPEPAPEPQTRVNERIRVPEVRLIDEDGAQVGIKSTPDALDYAYGKNLDLVEVAPQARPPGSWTTGSTGTRRSRRPSSRASTSPRFKSRRSSSGRRSRHRITRPRRAM